MHGALRARTAGRAARTALARDIRRAYRILLTRNGTLGWWPGRSRIEIIVGAILTQNTAWANVEQAIAGLRARSLLSVRGLRAASLADLEAAIRPSGYFRQKALKLKALLALLDNEFGGSLSRMARTPTAALRTQLLATWGIGPETADSILLYAFERPIFVVDAYTQRVAARHGWVAERIDYAGLQRLFTTHLRCDVGLYNDYHAQIVWVGKEFCRTRPHCATCPLGVLLTARSRGHAAAHGSRRRS